MATVFGIKTCDTCRKALSAFDAGGRPAAFRDVRADPLDAVTLTQFLDAFGMALVNTRSTTWRGLPEDERTEPPLDLLQRYPTLMKRPVIEGKGGLTLGWSEATRKAHLG